MHYYRRVSRWQRRFKSQDRSLQKTAIRSGVLRDTLFVELTDVAHDLKIPPFLIAHFEKGFCVRASYQTIRSLMTYYRNYALKKFSQIDKNVSK